MARLRDRRAPMPVMGPPGAAHRAKTPGDQRGCLFMAEVLIYSVSPVRAFAAFYGGGMNLLTAGGDKIREPASMNEALTMRRPRCDSQSWGCRQRRH